MPPISYSKPNPTQPSKGSAFIQTYRTPSNAAQMANAMHFSSISRARTAEAQNPKKKKLNKNIRIPGEEDESNGKRSASSFLLLLVIARNGVFHRIYRSY